MMFCMFLVLGLSEHVLGALGNSELMPYGQKEPSQADGGVWRRKKNGTWLLCPCLP